MPDSRATLRRLAAITGAAMLLGSLAGPAAAHSNPSGFKTKQSPMLTGAAGVTIRPLITVGERMPGGYRFEAIPDGISLRARGHGRVDVFVNHETSLVPFPYQAYRPANPTATPPTPERWPNVNNSQNDFDNAQLSRLVLNRHSKGVLSAKLVIRSDENFQRFCSNYMATAKEGFDRPILFTNEEATDVVNREGVAWPATPAFGSDPEQAGVVVAYDVRTGARKPIYGMGRHNHENNVAIPGFSELVMLSGDDTFTSNPAGSQLYSYIAADTDAVWNDAGALFGFKADDPAINDYYDFPVGSTMSVTGTFVEIPRAAAVGDQNALEAASDALGVFQFVRLEDIAYDKRPGMGNVVYVADTGRGATSAGGNAFTSSNGRIWKFVLDPANPRRVTSLSILVEGDDNPVKTLDEIHQPDNLETTPNGLYVTEDPGSSQQFPFGSTDPNATNGRVWKVALDGSSKSVVLTVDQAADEGPTDRDPATSKGNLGAWEASGIVDASSIWGPGWFLVDVQAHSLFIEVDATSAPDLSGPGNVPDGQPDWLYKREGGQLLAVHIPGG